MRCGQTGREKQDGSAAKKNKKSKADFWARNTMGGCREGKGIPAGVYAQIQTDEGCVRVKKAAIRRRRRTDEGRPPCSFEGIEDEMIW